MTEKKALLILSHMAEKIAPHDEISLLPGLQTRLQTSSINQPSKSRIPTSHSQSYRVRLLAIITTILALTVGLLLATPQGNAWAQYIMHFFTRAESDTLPLQSWQLTPDPTRTTPDPASIGSANLTVKEVEQQAGYHVLEPTWLPRILSFAGATFDTEKKIARIFYRYVETNGLVLREEPFQRADDCELCGEVGASAKIETIEIGGLPGEYVEGVWNLTENGPVWVSDPYLKTLRWQSNGMAFELMYMGPPDSVTKDDMVAIAESIK